MKVSPSEEAAEEAAAAEGVAMAEALQKHVPKRRTLKIRRGKNHLLPIATGVKSQKNKCKLTKRMFS
jgi:hypothetical protein